MLKMERPNVTVRDMFALIDIYGESEEMVSIRPECERDTWFSIPVNAVKYLSDELLNTRVEGIQADKNELGIWLLKPDNKKSN